MSKYDYNNNVLPVFIEKVGGILPAHTQNTPKSKLATNLLASL